MRDLVVRIRGIDSIRGPARLLIDEATERAWAFTAKGPPVATFTLRRGDGPRSAGQSQDGSVIWRRTSVGCGWGMAKCRVKTSELQAYVTADVT